jgi:1,4-alpha-glucan branching enzyme
MVAKQKINKTKVRKTRVRFVMPAINDCNSLYLVGKFNEWSESVYRMEQGEDGSWSLVLELEPGHEYQYRYRTDKGVWHYDPVANGTLHTPDGSNNSVIRV